jgi:hypothetical protein
MTQITRAEKLARFGELTKVKGVKRGTVFADELPNTAQLLIPHPMAGRPWKIIGPATDHGFYHLESTVSLVYNIDECRADYTRWKLCLPENQFRRIQ